MASKVFISYRRKDTASAAGRLYDRFCLLLGKRNVFFDVDAIPAGENFEAKIQTEIKKSNAVLVLIGRRWLDPDQPGETPRLFAANDRVRAEIRTALERKCFVLPVLVDGAPMPAPELLPEDIREVSLHNAVLLRHDSFESDADRVARTALGLSAGEVLWERKATVRHQIRGAIFGTVLAAVVLLAAALVHYSILHQPLEVSIGRAQTKGIMVAVLILGLISGLFYGSRSRG